MDQTLGKRIMHHRKRLNLTQDQLAEKLGITPQAVSKWENDLSCPDITMLPKLAAIFGITTDQLLGSAPEEDPAPPVFSGEVVEEDEPEGVHIEKNGWEFHWDSGRRSALGGAILILAIGIQLMIASALDRDLSFWNVFWPTALTVFGLTGMMGRLSFWNLGCTIFGCYFILDKWDLMPFSLGDKFVFPAILVILGLSLLLGALRKPWRPTFRFHHNGKAETNCTYGPDSFQYKGSFSEDNQTVTLEKLRRGEVHTNFGDFVVDLTGVSSVSDDCRVNAHCSFGDLVILIPRRFQVAKSASTAFASFDVVGNPDENPQGTIRLDAHVSFGEITVKYI